MSQETVYDENLFIDLRKLVDRLDLARLQERARKSPHGAVSLRFRNHEFWLKPGGLDKGAIADKVARMYFHRVKGYDLHSTDLLVDGERIPERYRAYERETLLN